MLLFYPRHAMAVLRCTVYNDFCWNCTSPSESSVPRTTTCTCPPTYGQGQIAENQVRTTALELTRVYMIGCRIPSIGREHSAGAFLFSLHTFFMYMGRC